MQAVSPSISVGGIPARIAFSSALIASCVSSSFWHNNECSLSSESSVVRYSVTAQCPECVFTTILEFHVCDDLPFDAVFGNDFITACAQGSSMFSPVPFLFIAKGLFGTRLFKMPPAKLFGFGKFSGLLPNQSQRGVWLHLVSTFRVTVPSLCPRHASCYHIPLSTHFHITIITYLSYTCYNMPPKGSKNTARCSWTDADES